MSGPTIYASNGKEQFTTENPAVFTTSNGSSSNNPNYVNVTNFPSTQAVSGTVSIGNTPIVSVNNYPSTQTISGNVSLLNIATNSGTDTIPDNSIGLIGSERLYTKNATTGVWSGLSSISTGLNTDTNLTATNTTLYTSSFPLGFNGTSWDRIRNNMEGTLLASLARTASTSSAIITNYNGKGVIVYLNVTVAPVGTETLTVQLKYVDPTSSVNSLPISFMVTPSTSTAGMYMLLCYPGASETPENQANNVTYDFVVPRRFQITVAHSGASSWTYSLGYSIIV